MKKIKYTIISTILVSSLLFAGCGKSSESSSSIDNVKLASNQKIVTAQITSILGNEMTYTVVEEYNAEEETTNSGSEEETTKKAATEDNSDEQGTRMSRNFSNRENETMGTLYTKTDETGEMLIPVGTVVTTILGTETTFSRLATNDVIKMIVETDDSGNETVLGIWIVA